MNDMNTATMAETSFTTSFVTPKSPAEAYAAICNPRAWWSGVIEGNTAKQGDVFTYRYQDLHFSRQQLTEAIDGRRVAWLVLESHLSFLEDKSEWTGTTMTFDIEPVADGTRVVFTHVGLKPAVECYDVCVDAWTSLIQGPLKQLIEEGDTRHIELRDPASR